MMEKEFDEWFNELEGFAFRSERFWDDFYYASKSGDTKGIVKWLQTAYQMGYNMGKQQYGGTE
jgi:hypothetical protein